MSKSYFLNIGVILTSLLLFSSCADKSIVDFNDKSSYIDYLKGKSESDLKIALAKDTLYLKTRIDSVKDIVFYEDFSLSPSADDESADAKLEPAKKFTLINADSIKQSFLTYNKTLFYTQKYALPNSEFSFSTAENSDYLLDRTLTYTITNAYLGKNKLMPTAVKLSTPDSLAVQTTYHYPTEFETLTIKKTTKTTTYQDLKIEIDTIYKGVVNFSLPGNLAPKILGCQAVNKDGVLMDSRGYYSYPNKGLSTKTLFALNMLKTTLGDAIKSSYKEKALATLDKIPENVFQLIADVNAFNDDIMKIDENEEDAVVMGQMEKINENYLYILGVKKQEIKMYFDDDVEKLHIFIATKSDTLTANAIAKAKDDDASNYCVFHQKDIDKYGVVDKQSNIIIKAEYNKLVNQENDYFEEQLSEKDKIQTYFLDVDHRKFINIPDGLSFLNKLAKGYDVFITEDKKAGILKNHTEKITPFAYRDISKKDNVFIAYGNQDEKRCVDLFDLDCDKLPINNLEDIDAYDDLNGMIVIDNKGLKGLLDKNGKLLLPVKYNGLYYLPGSNPMIVYYEKDAKYKSAQLHGLMTTDGKQLTPPIYRQINRFSEGLSLFNLLRGEYDEGNYGFLDTNGKVVLPPIYQDATGFNEGLAYVEKNGIYGLINPQGKFIVKFPQKDIQTFDDEGFGKDRTYRLDNKIYNYKGDFIKINN